MLIGFSLIDLQPLVAGSRRHWYSLSAITVMVRVWCSATKLAFSRGIQYPSIYILSLMSAVRYRSNSELCSMCRIQMHCNCRLQREAVSRCTSLALLNWAMQRPKVFFKIAINGQPQGAIVFEVRRPWLVLRIIFALLFQLFSDVVPRTAGDYLFLSGRDASRHDFSFRKFSSTLYGCTRLWFSGMSIPSHYSSIHDSRRRLRFARWDRR